MIQRNSFLKALPLAVFALFTVSIGSAAVQSHSIHDQIVVGSQNLVNDLNADLLDGKQGSHYQDPNPVDAGCGSDQYLGGDGACHNDQTGSSTPSCTDIHGTGTGLCDGTDDTSSGSGGDGYLPDDPATSNVDMNGNRINDVQVVETSNLVSTTSEIGVGNDINMNGNSIKNCANCGGSKLSDLNWKKCADSGYSSSCSLSCSSNEHLVAVEKKTEICIYSGTPSWYDTYLDLDLTKPVEGGSETVSTSNDGACDSRYSSAVTMTIACEP